MEKENSCDNENFAESEKDVKMTDCGAQRMHTNPFPIQTYSSSKLHYMYMLTFF